VRHPGDPRAGLTAYRQNKRSIGTPPTANQAALSGQRVITRGIAAARGAFAPGHLGELAQIMPFGVVGTIPAERGPPSGEPGRHAISLRVDQQEL
jgi:hypothetical protein